MADVALSSGVSAWLDETSLVLFGRNEWPYYDGVPDRDRYRILPDERMREAFTEYLARTVYDQVAGSEL